jgi:hypothetical protein
MGSLSFKHDAISRDDSQRLLDFAFWHDFERNGPSLYRMCETLKGWKRYRDYPDLKYGNASNGNS